MRDVARSEEEVAGGNVDPLVANLERDVAVGAETSAERGLTETRLAVLGIVVAIGRTVGLGFDATWWIGVLAGGGSFLFSCFVIRFRPARRQL